MRLTALALVLAVGVLDESATEYYHDFRNKDLLDVNLKLTGPDAVHLVKSEPEGLRITLPAERASNLSPVGAAIRFRITGDFEITTNYQILSAEKPKSRRGVGLEIHLMTDSPKSEATSIYHELQADGREIYVAVRMTTMADGKRGYAEGPYLKLAGARSGQLRLTRVGSQLIYSAADSEGKEFQELYRANLGTDDVKTLRLGATSGGPHAVDVRLLDMRVRAQGLVNVIETAGATDILPPRKSLWLVAFLSVVTLIIGGFWVWRRNRRNSEPVMEGKEDEPAGDAPAGM